MALPIGTRLGVYDVLALIGAGGMGEVYRAKDTKLGRDVAIKVVSELFARDPERVARFQREAQILASLNHPHIAAIYGLEEANGAQFLILELVEGETLAERLKAGPLPVDEALSVARQVADALQAAHEKGIIHRDLKPANIAFTADGQVKVLDFGLAKAMEPDLSRDISNSPTLTLAATQAGVVLGTAAYMSPEQAKGRAADKRSDVWAFGCVLYEMLAGKRAFEGEDVSDTLAAVLRAEPDGSALPADLPDSVRALIRRCLEKDKKQRIGDPSAALFVLTERSMLAASSIVNPPATVRVAVWSRIALFTAIAVGAGALATVLTWLATRSAAPHVSKLTMIGSGPTVLSINANDRDVAITPDGTRVVYVGNNGTQLFVRSLDTLEPRVIASGAIRAPFISPNGQWVGFVENTTTLKKIAITGGPAITLASLDGLSRGATWPADDTIIVATDNVATGLERVPAAGGRPVVLTHPNRAAGEADHLWPEAVPGGRAVLFTITSQSGRQDAAQVGVLDLPTNTLKVLIPGGSDAQYVASGHLVYVASGTLRAIPFDLGRLEVKGNAIPVVPRVATSNAGLGDFAVAAEGTLVYVGATTGSVGRMLVWADRTGKEEPIAAPPRAYVYPRISPGGSRAAVYSADEQQDIWLWDFRRTTLTRLTTEPGLDIDPVWTPDGRRIMFDSDRGGQRNLWWQPSDGTGTAERLTTSDNIQIPTGISPDGGTVVFDEGTPGGTHLMRLPLAGDRRPTSLLQTKANERNGTISPNGRWLAYQSDSSGRFEIYVRPFPNVSAGLWQVSTAGGTRPLWARSGKELFFLTVDRALMRVPIEATGTTWGAGTPTKLFSGSYFFALGNPQPTYDISPDGQRFLMIKVPGNDQNAPPPSLIVVQHFDEELKRLVPTR